VVFLLFTRVPLGSWPSLWAGRAPPCEAPGLLLVVNSPVFCFPALLTPPCAFFRGLIPQCLVPASISSFVRLRAGCLYIFSQDAVLVLFCFTRSSLVLCFCNICPGGWGRPLACFFMPPPSLYTFGFLNFFMPGCFHPPFFPPLLNQRFFFSPRKWLPFFGGTSLVVVSGCYRPGFFPFNSPPQPRYPFHRIHSKLIAVWIWRGTSQEMVLWSRGEGREGVRPTKRCLWLKWPRASLIQTGFPPTTPSFLLPLVALPFAHRTPFAEVLPCPQSLAVVGHDFFTWPWRRFGP